MVEGYLGLLVWADKGWKRPVVVYLGMPLLFLDSRGVGPLNLGQSQVCTKAKVGRASEKDEPLSGTLKGDAACKGWILLQRKCKRGVFFSCERVEEGIVLVVQSREEGRV